MQTLLKEMPHQNELFMVSMAVENGSRSRILKPVCMVLKWFSLSPETSSSSILKRTLLCSPGFLSFIAKKNQKKPMRIQAFGASSPVVWVEASRCQGVDRGDHVGPTLASRNLLFCVVLPCNLGIGLYDSRCNICYIDYIYRSSLYIYMHRCRRTTYVTFLPIYVHIVYIYLCFSVCISFSMCIFTFTDDGNI